MALWSHVNSAPGGAFHSPSMLHRTRLNAAPAANPFGGKTTLDATGPGGAR
jgi:hypothetical protein